MAWKNGYEAAEELLYNTREMNITDVAMGSGFSSRSAFNRTFQMIKHCSPSDYRKIKQQMYESEE